MPGCRKPSPAGAPPLDFPGLVDGISRADEILRRAAAGSVNRLMTMRNGCIGYWIVEFEQRGSDRAAYGAGLLARLSGELTARGMKGVSVSGLRNFRQFYTMYACLGRRIMVEIGDSYSRQVRQGSAVESSAGAEIQALAPLLPIQQKPSGEFRGHGQQHVRVKVSDSPAVGRTDYAFSAG